MYRIWFERKVPADYLSLLEGRVQPLGAALAKDGCDLDAACATLPQAEAVIAAARLRYDGRLLDTAPQLKVICRTGIGYDNVDLAAATARGIAVCNVPDGPTISTAEHTFALLLAVAKNVAAADRALRDGVRGDFFSMYNGVELEGRTLGLVGMGRIGRRVARFAQAFGMHVLVYDPLVDRAIIEAAGVSSSATLEDVLRAADIVSLHLPLSPETRGLIDAARLAVCKRGAILINAARGGLVDEAALLAALESGHIAGAGLDVFEIEPPPTDHPLVRHPAVVSTPHIASATVCAKTRLWKGALDQALMVLQGQRPPHLLNPSCWPA